MLISYAGLKSQDLESKPKFEALSYCWGPKDEEKETIKVNGYNYEVLPRLRKALQQLRDLILPRHLWIDKICISQESNQEQEAQVAIMRQIFAAAERTIAWLGESDDESSMIFRACNEMRTKLQPDVVAKDFKAV